MATSTTIAVCGATGQQGGAVVEALIKKGGWNIVALSRNPESAKSMVLSRKGVTVVKADLLDRDSLVKAFQNCTMVFGVTQPFSADYKSSDTIAEVRQGINIIEACMSARVDFLVMSTMLGSGGAKTGVPHGDSKTDFATYLKNSTQPYVILKPASFMDNIGSKFFPVKKGIIRGLTDKDVKIPYISTRDIGEIAALVLEQPERYQKRELNLVADFVSGGELAELMGKIRKNEHFKYTTTPRIALWLFARDFYAMRVAFEKAGRQPYPPEIAVAIRECREMHPEILTLEKYLLHRDFDSKVL
jgi:uncharacterized protein YbjT (DUF2867 family)